MRHGDVAYFAADGRPLGPEQAVLTPRGRERASAAGRALREVRLDRVLTSGLPRTLETAELVVAELERPPARPQLEQWPELREVRGGRLAGIPDAELERTFLHAFRGVVPPASTFLGGETIGSLQERVLAALQRLLADPGWETALLVLHGAVNRAILSYALAGEPLFFGHLEQSPACVNILDAGDDHLIVRTVNATPYDLAHLGARATTMEELYEQYLPYRRRLTDEQPPP